MKQVCSHVIVTRMEPQRKLQWDQPIHKYKRIKKQPPLFATIAAAVSLCIGVTAYGAFSKKSDMVLSHLTAGFEYDETLGRLQYVSNILPESAMVFLETGKEFDAKRVVDSYVPAVHDWSQDEPWLEYNAEGSIVSCEAGDVMTVVKNSRDTYTVRIMHEDGYESIYSGLISVSAQEGDSVSAGSLIGTISGNAAFELRKDGLSIQPVFSEI